MKTILYGCDRCERVQDHDNQMWQIEIRLKHLGASYITSWDTSETQLWCRRCVDTLQLSWFPRPQPEIQPIQEQSFEDKLREIIRCEIQEASIGK